MNATLFGGDRLPSRLRVIIGVYLILMVLGVVQGVRELLGLIEGLRGLVGGGGFGTMNFGASVAAGGTGVALWKGLRDGNQRAWKTVRRASFLAAPFLALGALVVLVVDPSNVTISSPAGDVQGLAHPAMAAALLGGGALFAGWQGWVLGRPAIRGHFFGGAASSESRNRLEPKGASGNSNAPPTAPS